MNLYFGLHFNSQSVGLTYTLQTGCLFFLFPFPFLLQWRNPLRPHLPFGPLSFPRATARALSSFHLKTLPLPPIMFSEISHRQKRDTHVHKTAPHWSIFIFLFSLIFESAEWEAIIFHADQNLKPRPLLLPQTKTLIVDFGCHGSGRGGQIGGGRRSGELAVESDEGADWDFGELIQARSEDAQCRPNTWNHQ